ncbi:LUD domain-containing protein [Streptomyces olindensis]|uniref:LUD domain-containing protein n=1 Tax=Streptomyces olindensis TaxID=358823 RepID=A0ABV2XS05_9ACTN
MNQLDAANAVITTVATAIAVTGSVTLDHGPGQGRRALTLLPDQHVCVVRASQIAPDVPEALNRLDPYRPLTLVSGPSATSVGDRRSPPPCAQPPPGTARRTGPAPRRHAGRRHHRAPGCTRPNVWRAQASRWVLTDKFPVRRRSSAPPHLM